MVLTRGIKDPEKLLDIVCTGLKWEERRKGEGGSVSVFVLRIQPSPLFSLSLSCSGSALVCEEWADDEARVCSVLQQHSAPILCEFSSALKINLALVPERLFKRRQAHCSGHRALRNHSFVERGPGANALFTFRFVVRCYPLQPPCQQY